MGQGSLRVPAGDGHIQIKISLPVKPAPSEALLPGLRELDGQLIAAGVATAQREGREVSCRAGCGACCRQVVPIGATEARHLARYVRSLPEDRRQALAERARAGMQRLAEAGVLDEIDHFWSADRKTRNDLAIAYFKSGAPCPFLENESCGIYAERPLVCREFLVTSDPVLCATPWEEGVEGVKIPLRLNPTLLEMDRQDQTQDWQPLLVMLYRVLCNDETFKDGPERDGETWLAHFADALGKTHRPPAVTQ